MGAPARYLGPPAAGQAPAEQAPAVLECALCPRLCRIGSDAAGRCGVRLNAGGKAALPYYGLITALAEDPIEKKPLYHFRPGSSILSLGFAFCNLRCPFCQNWAISQPGRARPGPAELPGRRLSPAQALALARERGFSQIAYTYSEPLMHIEWLLECMTLCRREGIATVLVTNGCVNSAPAAEILALTDAANVDLKCFSAETYEKVLGGNLSAVLRFIEAAHNAGTHLEITTLIVPELNDGDAETTRCADFIAGLSRDIPWHLSAYHPDYRYEAPATAPAALASIARMGRERLRYVYTGNVPGERNDTPCPRCGAVLVSRRGYRVDVRGLAAQETPQGRVYRCARCGEAAPLRG
jgi:pyruvate formate lyase activating enzyme